MATAVRPPLTEPLTGSQRADVTILGAGITGLNAALALAKNGVKVVVLDAKGIGFGASGRSGGQVNLGLNDGPTDLIKRYGQSQGERTIQLVLNTPNTVFDLIKEHNLQCDAVQRGWVQASVSESMFSKQRQLAREYAPYQPVFDILDAQEVQEQSGAEGYVGGLRCPMAGSLHPLSYTRELARVAQSLGVSIYTDSAVHRIEAVSNGWQVHTEGGNVRSNTVLVCTNGYTTDTMGQPLNGLSKAVVPVRSVLIASEPLSDNIKKSVLPDEVTFVDKRRLILYARYARDGRLCIGDHGPMRDAFAASDFDHVKQRALRVFPQLEGVKWEYQWGGRVAMTQTGLPFIHEVAPGLIAGMGFNGRGVGAGTMMGQELAKYVVSGDKESLGFPVTQPKPFLMHRFQGVGVSMSIKWYALMDYLSSQR